LTLTSCLQESGATVKSRGSIPFHSSPFTASTLWFANNVWPKLLKVQEENAMLWTVFVVLLILWLLGFSFHIAGGLIHLLLVIAVAVLIINLLTGRRSAV
jgi:uncharacterized protein DUF5670